jgi:tetratricopeptide (TPR) repeat protein
VASELWRASGGNPLFLTEALKAWIEAGRGGRLPPLPPDGRVHGVVRARLARLSPDAQRLAWVAAVAGDAFDAALADRVLEAPSLALAEAQGELERAQVLVGGRFGHDLLHEAVLAAVPTVVRALLQRRVAGALEGAAVPPAVIAVHWRAAGDLGSAAPWFLRAAQAAERRHRWMEAADAYAEAARGFEARGVRADAFAAVEAELTVRFMAGGHGLERGCADLARLALNAQQKARAYRAEAELHVVRGRLAEAERVAIEALAWAEQADEVPGLLDTLNTLAGTHYEQGRYREAAAWLERAVHLCRLHDAAELPIGLNNLALVWQAVGRVGEALAQHREAFRLAQSRDNLVTSVAALNNQARAQLAFGRPDEAEKLLRRSLELAQALADPSRFHQAAWTLLGAAAADQDRRQDALDNFACARQLAARCGFRDAEARIGVAECLSFLGAGDEALALLEPVAGAPGPHQVLALIVSAEMLDADAALARLDAAADLPAMAQHLAWRLRAACARARIDPEHGGAVAELLAEARTAALPPLELAGCLALAEVELARGRHASAAVHLRAADRAAGAMTSRRHDLPRKLLQLRWLEAARPAAAVAERDTLAAWLRSEAARHPAAYRERFLAVPARAVVLAGG